MRRGETGFISIPVSKGCGCESGYLQADPSWPDFITTEDSGNGIYKIVAKPSESI